MTHLVVRLMWLVFGLLLLQGLASAQQTIFNVPSGDVMEKGKGYGEFDVSYRPSDQSAGYTPRAVVGIGHNVEIGLNVSGLNTPGTSQTTLSPALKWRVYEGSSKQWSLLIGDNVYIPLQNRAYDAGNYLWIELTKTWSTKTRATVGAYHFTHGPIADAQRAGGQFGIEQPIGSRLTVAADWYTGEHSLGYFTPGFILKLTQKVTWYGSYQIGNHGTLNGNHQFLTEIGWNFN